MDDLFEHINITWQDTGLDEQAYSGETVSYVITSELERFPEKNEKLVFAAEYTKNNDSDTEVRKALHIHIAQRDDNTINEIIVKVIIA